MNRLLSQVYYCQNSRCYWCQQKFTEKPHLDHVWPLAKNGTNGAENVVLACRTCNLKKGDKTPMEFGGRLL